MKRTIIISLLCLLCGGAMQAQKIRIKTGIEVLKEQNFRCLEIKRVGSITNPTGVDNRMRSTIDILHEAPNVNLVALYGPEHGVRGDVHAGDHVTDIKKHDYRTARLFALRKDPQGHAGHAERCGCISV